MKRSLAFSTASFALAVASSAAAEGVGVPLDVVAAGSIKVNGALTEWTRAMTPLAQKISGNPGSGADLGVKVSLAFDDGALYVAGDVTDDKLVRTASYGEGEDHLSLVIAFPNESGGYTPFELNLFPGDPGNVAGAVFLKGGGKVSAAQLVEAPYPNKGGYTFEAKIPWGTFPPAAKTRVGLRGVVRFHDSDGGGVKGVIASSNEPQAAKMPRLLIDAERGIEEAAHEKGLSGAPQDDVVVDVTGDDMRERVMRWDQFVLVCGPHFREGKEFLFHDLAVDRTMIPSYEVRDVTGDAKAEIVVKKRIGSGNKWREVLQILGMPGDAITTLFVHEIGMSTDAGVIQNHVKLSSGQIEVSLGTSSATQATFREAPETAFDGALLPWGTIKSQTYKWEGGKFGKVKEESKPAGGDGDKPAPKAASEGPPQPPPARPPTADEMQDQLLALYKRDRKVPPKETPRFDLAANVAEGAENERILVFGRDLVVFGKGFLKGSSYVMLGVGFADAKDVLSVTTRDLTGDGHAEILVRGVLHMKAPKELGTGTLDREVLLVYAVQDAKLVRVFGAETGLSMGDKRLTGTLAFQPTAKGTVLVLGPGHAVGWDPKSYPYKQDTAPVGALEPIVLPWTEGTVKFAWNGSAFAR